MKLLLISEAYVAYREMRFASFGMKNEQKYKDAESMSDFFQSIGFNVVPSDFIVSKDELVESGMNGYDELERIIAHSEENLLMTRQTIMAVVKRAEHNISPFIWNLMLPFQIKSLAMYSVGEITKDELMEELAEVSIFGKKAKHIDKKTLYNSIIKIEQIYKEVEQTQVKRAWKKLAQELELSAQ